MVSKGMSEVPRETGASPTHRPEQLTNTLALEPVVTAAGGVGRARGSGGTGTTATLLGSAGDDLGLLGGGGGLRGGLGGRRGGAVLSVVCRQLHL